MKKSIFTFAVGACALASAVFAGPITRGNIVVVRLGDGVAAPTGSTAAVNLVEYTPAGTEVQTIALPSTGTNAFSIGGTATTEGNLNVSVDGNYLTLAGYALAAGTASPQTATNARAIARVSIGTGAVDTSTKITNTTLASSTSIRGAVTNDGNQFWVSTGDKGVVYVPSFGTTQEGTTITAAVNLRSISVFQGQLYVNSGSATPGRGVSSVGTGLPTAATQTFSLLSGFPTTVASPYQFQFDTPSRIFVGENSTGNISVEEWVKTGSTWAVNTTSTLTAAPSVGVAIGMDGATPTVFATNQTSILKMPKATPGTLTSIAAVPTNTLFRGIVAIPASSKVRDWEKF